MNGARIARLFVVSTPIGNLEDMTPRARRILSEVSHLIVEDTRETKKLLSLCGISLENKHLLSMASHNMKEALPRALKLLESGCDLAVLSDRGTPGISDPGALLVDEARDRGFSIIPIPGASSVTAALSVSGLDSSRFLFLGFPGRSGGERAAFFDRIHAAPFPVVLLEAPHRIRATLDELKQLLPERYVFIARELTKQFETLYWESLSDLDPTDIPELGEFTLVVSAGKTERNEDALEDSIRLRLQSDRDWSKEVAKRCGLSASEVYNAMHRERDHQRKSGE